MSLWIWEVDWRLSNEEIHTMLVSIEEWWDSNNHLKNEDSKSPPIYSEVMSISNQHLWSKVLGCTTERVCKLSLFDKFGETKVCHQKIS